MHAHIIPRHTADLPEDEIYRLLESDDADLARAHGQRVEVDTPSTEQLARGLGKEELELADDTLKKELLKKKTKGFVPAPDVERVPRSEEEMREEAEWLARKIAELET